MLQRFAARVEPILAWPIIAALNVLSFMLYLVVDIGALFFAPLLLKIFAILGIIILVAQFVLANVLSARR